MARVFFDNIKNLGGDKLIVPVYLDTGGENINAFEIRLKVKNLIFRDYFEKDSIVAFWVERPRIDKDILSFVGVIPGGYIGKKGQLIKLVFENQDRGYLEVLPSSQFLLNDGKGTKTKTDGYFLALDKSPSYKTLEIIDRYPPERFVIYLNKDLNGRYYITFDAKDKQSGIAYYEIIEKQNFYRANVDGFHFTKVHPPYTLKDQSLRSYVFVRAVDKFGNERIEILKPQVKILLDEILFLLIIIILPLLFYLNYNKTKTG